MFQSDSLSKVATDYSNALNLIDTVFSVEFCLQHQVVPLELFDNHLVIGMIYPKNRDSIQHINNITNSLSYSFHIQSIEDKTHQLILAAYLKSESGKSDRLSQNIVENSFQKASPAIDKSATLFDLPPEEKASPAIDKSATLFDLPPEEKASPAIDKSATLFDLPPEEKTSPAIDKSATLFDLPPEEKTSPAIDKSATLFDLPPEEKASLAIDKSATLFDLPSEEKVSPAIDKSATLFDLPPEEEASFKQLSQKSEMIVTKPSAKSHIFFSEPQINNLQHDNVAISRSTSSKQNNAIDVRAKEVTESIESLINLHPKKLWQKLLDKILENEICELNLQRNKDSGCIIYYQNEVVQSSIKQLPLNSFNAINQEIKNMARLPISKLDKPRKIAIQKIHNNQKVLLRIEFTLGKFGEEAKINILSGQALNLYEQKQLDKNIEQAIILCKKLEKIIIKIQSNQNAGSYNQIKALKKVVKQIENKLDWL